MENTLGTPLSWKHHLEIFQCRTRFQIIWKISKLFGISNGHARGHSALSNAKRVGQHKFPTHMRLEIPNNLEKIQIIWNLALHWNISKLFGKKQDYLENVQII